MPQSIDKYGCYNRDVSKIPTVFSNNCHYLRSTYDLKCNGCEHQRTKEVIAREHIEDIRRAMK